MSDLLYDTYLQRKEYREIKPFQQTKSRLWITPAILELSAVQFLAKRYFNPNTQQSRCLLKLGPGTGKTLSSLEIALPYIKIFSTINQKLNQPYYVHIIGFTKGIYKNEFLKFPELGIITYDELHQLRMLKELSLTASDATRDRIREDYKKLKIKITRRISDASVGGMYNFTGYKELYNNLFVSSKFPEGTDESNIYERVMKGEIQVNKLLLNLFANSLVICDEIHLAYNTEDTNNYGLAIQLILDYHGKNITAVFLSATIINNNKREIISIANMMRDPTSPHFKSSDYFSNDKTKKFDAASLKPIYDQMKDKVIFLEETGSDYPELVFDGKSYGDIPYLKFDIARMSPLHEQTFRLDDLYRETTSNFIILDMVYPNPEFSFAEHMALHPDREIANEYRSKIKDESRITQVKGIYNTETSVSLIRNASPEWRNKFGINVKESKGISYIAGAFLRYNNLQLYSSKYCAMLDIIYRTLKANPFAKFIIYHPFVRGSGIMTIGEILSENGFIDKDSIPIAGTYSAEEFITQAEWIKKYPNRQFFPARYFVVQFDVTESQKSEAVDKWNSESNKYGLYTKFFIGAGKIKQSIDFKNTTEMIIVQKPNTISDFIQIKGRVIRKKSLASLPADMQKVHLHTLLSVGEKPNAIEPRKYAKKLAEFDNIRAIEYYINKNAINNYMYDEFVPIDILSAFPFKNTVKLPKQINENTYYTHDYYKDMLDEISKQIKRAFVSVPVWTYETLQRFVDDKCSSLNTSYSHDLFNIVLKKMVYSRDTYIDNKNVLLFDSENIIINKRYIDGIEIVCPNKVIIEYGEYLLLATIRSDSDILVDQDMFFDDNVSNIIRYVVAIESDEIIKSTAIDKLLSIVKTFNASKLESFSYVFLISWPPEAHYIFMRDYLTNPKSQIPIQLINMYKRLKILHGDPRKPGSWYDERYVRYTLNSKGEFTQGDKQLQIRVDSKPLIGIIKDSSLKIRDSRNDDSNDGRNVIRGISCSNIVKSAMTNIVNEFGIDIKGETKNKRICAIILRFLVDKEIKSRSSGEGVRYLYLFNEN